MTMAFGVVAAIALFWLAPILVGRRITENKGRGAGQGMMYGFLLGWIGVIIAATLKDLRPEQAQITANQKAAMYRECPHCKEPMRRDATVCPHCRGVSPVVLPALDRRVQENATAAARFNPDDRPASADERLAEATTCLERQKFPRAVSILEEDLPSSVSRGDAEWVGHIEQLAQAIADHRNTHRVIAEDARRVASSARTQLEIWEASVPAVDETPMDSSTEEELILSPTALALPSSGNDAIEIARRRYAAGEITRDEFRLLLADLNGE
jgi:Short C-terminal domain